MRFLLLTHRFPPDPDSAARFGGGLARALRRAGHEVTVLTSRPRDPAALNGDGRSGWLAVRRAEDGVEVVRHRVWRWGARRWGAARALNHASFHVLGTLSSLYTLGEFDATLSTDATGLTGAAAAVLRELREIPFVYVLRDAGLPPFPDGGSARSARGTEEEADGASEPPTVPAFRRIRARLEPRVYRRASHLAVTAPSYRERLLRRGVPRTRLTVIPGFVDTDFFRPLSRDNALSRSRGLADKFVVAYAGVSDGMHGLDQLLQAAFLLRDRGGIRWVVGGRRGDLRGLRRRARDLGLRNVTLVPATSPDTLRWLRATSDVGVLFQRQGTPARSLPPDVYEIMASGRAVVAVAREGSDLAELVGFAEAGLRVPPDDAEALADAVEALYRAPERRVELGLSGRRTAEEYFSLEVVGREYERLLREAAGS